MSETMPIFKSKTLQEPGPKKRMWKSLKQITTAERNVYGLNSEAVLCMSTKIKFANWRLVKLYLQLF